MGSSPRPGRGFEPTQHIDCEAPRWSVQGACVPSLEPERGGRSPGCGVDLVLARIDTEAARTRVFRDADQQLPAAAADVDHLVP